MGCAEGVAWAVRRRAMMSIAQAFAFVVGTGRLKVRGLSVPHSAGTAVAALHPSPCGKEAKQSVATQCCAWLLALPDPR